jgi:ABC-2 type transport system permease protein
VRAYRAILAARFRALLQYRAAALAGVGTQLFWGLIRVMALGAFYRAARGPQPLHFGDMVSYVWLTQALLLLLPWRPDPDVDRLIRSGNVAYELLRPQPLYATWYVRAVALRTAPMLLRWPPVVLVAALCFGLRAPPSAADAALFLAGVAGAVALGAAITALIDIALLWMMSARGVVTLLVAALTLLSGAIVPLPLFPDWLQPLLAWQPFRGLMDTPLRLYLGHLPARAAALALAHQALWTALLVLLGTGLVRLAQRRIVVQGG